MAGIVSRIRALDAEIYRLYLAGKRDGEIVEWLRTQGHEVDRTTVLRARQRAEKEAALGAPVEPVAGGRELPEVEVTDDMILHTVLRDLAKGYQEAKKLGDDRIKLDHAKRIAELAVARVRIRPPAVAAARGGQVLQGQQTAPPVADEDLVTFN
jgi:hypothetical protein